ncbi:MAG: hypothetical protein PHT02_00580 [Tissierellia bacterium]|nr:hypothetical protein [Tissierellia bacterium]
MNHSNDGFRSMCLEREKEYSKLRKRANYDTYYRDKQMEWNRNNKEHKKELNRRYLEEHPDMKKAALERFYENNPEKMKKRQSKTSQRPC